MLHEDGYGVVTGRIKDIIIRGGENIQPQSIEYFLESHPEILQAQVSITNYRRVFSLNRFFVFVFISLLFIIGVRNTERQAWRSCVRGY